MFRSTLALSILALVFVAPGLNGNASAKRKPKNKLAKPACGLNYLPMSEGTSWTYQYAEIPVPEGEAAPRRGFVPTLPNNLFITVKSVESTGKNSAKITLQESYFLEVQKQAKGKSEPETTKSEVSKETVLTCDAEGLHVPLNSFFYAGEPSGAIGTTLENVTVDKAMYPTAKLFVPEKFLYTTVKADVIRTAAPGTKAEHLKAAIVMDRQITIGAQEVVEVEHGIHKAFPATLEIVGRITLDAPDAVEFPLPDNGIATLWFTPGYGVVRAYNRLGQGWELKELKNAAGELIGL